MTRKEDNSKLATTEERVEARCGSQSPLFCTVKIAQFIVGFQSRPGASEPRS